MPTPRHSVSVAGIVINEENRVLLIQRRDNSHWEPPGGVLELGETFEQGVVREVYEETGVEVSVGDLTGVYKNMPLGIVALVFRCRMVGGSRRISEEAYRIEWFSLANAKARMSPAFYVRIEDAFHSRVAVRSHDGVEVVDPGR